MSYYLIIRPVSSDPQKTEPYLPSLSNLTGLDRATVRQKFTGQSLQVLKSLQDRSVLQELAAKLLQEGFPSVLLSKAEITKGPKPIRVSSIQIRGKSLSLIGSGTREVHLLDGSQNALLVLSTMRVRELRRKIMAKLLMTKNGAFPLSDMLRFIFHHDPVMDMYVSDFDRPLRFNSLKFNYHCLGKENTQSVALNFPLLIQLIKQSSSKVTMDTGFAENSLPFINIPDEDRPERLLDEFARYSRFVFLAHEQMATHSEHNPGPLSSAPPFEGLQGLSWMGPLLIPLLPPMGETKGRESEPGGVPDTETRPSVLPPPPVVPTDIIAGQIGTWGVGIIQFFKNYRRYVHLLGPAVLIYPLTLTFLACFLFGYGTRHDLFFSIGLLSLGMICFIHSFVMLKRKRAIENCPTTKIRSMPMGLVEVKGVAKPKYFLKAPYSLTDCVHYSFKKYTWERVGKDSVYRLSRWGESGRVPFYIEDETGSVLVEPENAIIKAGISQDMSQALGGETDGMDSFQHSAYGEGVNQKIVEKVIATGQSLYVMGFARPIRTGTEQRKKAFFEKLRHLKKDRSRMGRYDLDRDGTISDDEWERARRETEEEVMMEKVETEQDRFAIGEHPTGGLFYVSDQHEEFLTRFMACKIPISLGLGVIFIIGGLSSLVGLL